MELEGCKRKVWQERPALMQSLSEMPLIWMDKFALKRQNPGWSAIISDPP